LGATAFRGPAQPSRSPERVNDFDTAGVEV
jgi:hypothetical protein